MIYTRKGKIIAGKWPRKRGPPKTVEQANRQEWFRQANLLAKYADARQQALSRCTMNALPVRPFDALLAAMAGRLWAVETDDGKTLYSMSSRGDVSKNIDIICQEEGRLLIRGPTWWECFPWGDVDQYIASQGEDTPPIWKDLPPGGGGGAGIFGFGSDTALSSNGTRYYGVGVLQTDESKAELIAPRGMTVKNLAVAMNIAPFSGGSLVVTFRKNGADTALTVTLTDADTEAINTTNTIVLAQGDRLAIKTVATNIEAARRANITVDVAPDPAAGGFAIPAARLKKTVNQNIAPNTFVVINWDGVDFEDWTSWDPATPHKLFPKPDTTRFLTSLNLDINGPLNGQAIDIRMGTQAALLSKDIALRPDNPGVNFGSGVALTFPGIFIQATIKSPVALTLVGGTGTAMSIQTLDGL